MKINEVGEKDLIKILDKLISKNKKKLKSNSLVNQLISIGDDGSVWSDNSANYCITTDSMIENVHFNQQFTNWQDLGWKAISVNQSDIAAMGFDPLYCVVSIGIPKNTEIQSLKKLYKGMIEAIKKNGGEIVGGDTVHSPIITINISMIGIRKLNNDNKRNFLSRSKAKPKDLIAVTGYLGSSAGGFEILKNTQNVEGKITKYLKKAHLKPQPKVQTGIELCDHGINSAIDISDGLVQDITRICKASNVGAKILTNKIPVHKYLKKAFPENWLSFALNGGEDYELLFTGPSNLIKQICEKTKTKITIIGEITKSKKVEIVNKTNQKITKNEWEHFIK
ncbi:MAG: thiamine-phosphate kinase [SAR202 cluster bacterium]|nr:thiamine-phosphate kinase [SAR202 cluster bacterium]|tara:strand:- start:25335 stop:26345 length:1011 start_codon:yes stop_codon:yes gene_type:complete